MENPPIENHKNGGFSHQKTPPKRHRLRGPAASPGALRAAVRSGQLLGAADHGGLGLSLEDPGGCPGRIWSTLLIYG